MRTSVLRLVFHDIDGPRPGYVAPAPSDIAAALSFAAGWDGEAPLLVSCALGISRSPAFAYAIACARAPVGHEDGIARALRAAAPCCTPNRRVVALADAALGREGRMVAAIEGIGRGAEYVPQAGFALDLAAGA